MSANKTASVQTIINKLNLRAQKIENKLKEQIKKRGYSENLGQKELRDFTTYVKTFDLQYSDECKFIDIMRGKIERL